LKTSYQLAIFLLAILTILNNEAHPESFRPLTLDVDPSKSVNFSFLKEPQEHTRYHFQHIGRPTMLLDASPTVLAYGAALTALPPWWQSLWAYVLFFVLFILGIFFLRRYEMKRLQIKNQLEVEKRESHQLRQANEIKSNFIANISHELRTPLNMITAQLECLSDSRLLDEIHKERVAMAQKSSGRLLIMINQLLDMARIESGKMTFQKQYTDLSTFVSDCVHSFESMAEVKKIHLSYFAEKAFMPAHIDQEKYRSIVYNLISNAIKFTDPLGKVEVKLLYVEDHKIQLRVRDTGIGISKEAIPFIFDRFYQAETLRNHTYEGTGIGLAIVRQFIEMHGGRIQVLSEPGEGSEFNAVIPVGDITTDIKVSHDYSGKIPWTNLKILNEPVLLFKELSSIKPENQEVILLVDDNTEFRKFIYREFVEHYHIMEAENGDEGLEKALTEIPDLIITDVMMPQMDGIAFLSAVRSNEKTSHIPVILLSGKATLENRIEGLEAGVDAYLTKPFNLKELRLLVFNMIQQRKKFREKFSKSFLIKPAEVSLISADQTFYEKTIRIINQNLQDPKFGVDQLAEMLNMSPSQLNRKVNALIEQSPGHLVRSFRLRRASDLLKSGMQNMAEVCELSGFGDQAYFSRAFKKEFGVSPSKYVDK
jgi:two-component system, sensor histidine kinase ChiS